MGSAGPLLDDRLTSLLSTLPSSSSHFSLEFFPPKTRSGFVNLQSRLARMVTALRPLFVTVTWGAGGSTATKSLELAEICQRQLGIPTVLHLTCTNNDRTVVDEALAQAKAIGVRNILALRGDPPRDEYKDDSHDTTRQNGESTGEEEDFVWAVDLVRYIKRKHGSYFCVGVAGYPEGHADESHPEAGKQSVTHDLPYLADKIRAGADFIMTQLTFDTKAFAEYEAQLNEYVDTDGNKDVFRNIPVVPGLMPIQSYQITKRITKLSHATIPAPIAKRIEEVKDDDGVVKKVGVDILSEIVEGIKALPRRSDLPRIMHFYTLNLEKSVAFILERCKLIPPASQSESRDEEAVGEEEGDAAVVQSRKNRRASSINAQAHNRVLLDRAITEKPTIELTEADNVGPEGPRRHEVDGDGSGIPASQPTREQNLRISEGQGSLGREATWDDFPNGRWGPSHSPAFGEIDGYGPSLKVGPVTARKLWGEPKCSQDITNIFKRHVLGELDAVPWSDDIDIDGTSGGAGALREETKTIRQELLGMIEGRGFWTLASQPAVDGVKSDDPVFGWGPKGEGFVFQKAFVEFFCPQSEWEGLKQKLKDASIEEFSWLKTDARGGFESSETTENHHHHHSVSASTSSHREPGTSGVNAVTWGVFRGKEIITPTIIEAESFRAWGEEAFSIWGEWRRCFPRGSVQEQYLETLQQNTVLVNVVGQNYLGGHQRQQDGGGGLWRLLLER